MPTTVSDCSQSSPLSHGEYLQYHAWLNVVQKVTTLATFFQPPVLVAAVELTEQSTEFQCLTVTSKLLSMVLPCQRMLVLIPTESGYISPPDFVSEFNL